MEKGCFFGVPTALTLAALTLGTTLAADGSLPGGTSIGLTIDSPSDGTEIELPPGQTTVDVDVVGTASIGEGGPIADNTLIYVLDASGSAEGPAGVNCPDQNPIDGDSGDPVPDENEIIDCEIAAAINLNDVAITMSFIDEVAMIAFAGNGVTADATPGGSDDPMIAPDADADTNGTADVNEVLQSIRVAETTAQQGGFVEFAVKNLDIIFTDYADAIREVIGVAALTTNRNVTVVFISDGKATGGTRVHSVLPGSLPVGKNVVFHTFAIPSGGSAADCNLNPYGRGSLQDIADLTGGTCTEVPDPSTLPDILPAAIIPTLDSLEIAVDGGAPDAIDNSDIDPDLPQDGPTTVAYNTTVFGLGIGDPEICVTANGSDSGGSGNVTECVTIRVVSPSSADLAISKADSPDPVEAGGSLTYTIEVSNNGPADATGVILTDTLPAGVTFVSSAPGAPTCAEASGTVTCDLGFIASGASSTVGIVVTVDPSTEGTIINTASVTASGPDSDPSDNATTEDTRVHVGWREVCVSRRMEITGTGMGDRYHTVNPQIFCLADPASVGWVLVQVAGRYFGDAPSPEPVTFTTDAPESLTLSQPTSNGPLNFTFEANLRPTGQITASVSNPGDSYKTPRGLILYSKRATTDTWTSVGNTTNDYVCAGRGDCARTEILTFPPLAEATDLYVTAVVIDNDDDPRSMVLEAVAGDVADSVTEPGPTDGDGLSIVNLTLPQIPAGVGEVKVTLRSPPENGDSLVLVGLNVSHLCQRSTIYLPMVMR